MNTERGFVMECNLYIHFCCLFPWPRMSASLELSDIMPCDGHWLSWWFRQRCQWAVSVSSNFRCHTGKVYVGWPAMWSSWFNGIMSVWTGFFLMALSPVGQHQNQGSNDFHTTNLMHHTQFYLHNAQQTFLVRRPPHFQLQQWRSQPQQWRTQPELGYTLKQTDPGMVWKHQQETFSQKVKWGKQRAR